MIEMMESPDLQSLILNLRDLKKVARRDNALDLSVSIYSMSAQE